MTTCSSLQFDRNSSTKGPGVASVVGGETWRFAPLLRPHHCMCCSSLILVQHLHVVEPFMVEPYCTVRVPFRSENFKSCTGPSTPVGINNANRATYQSVHCMAYTVYSIAPQFVINAHKIVALLFQKEYLATNLPHRLPQNQG